ncbi:MAG TPA: histidine phosphatase family protein [Thermomicrobiales bacterium]|nr:histidine phosphatase family protein [Thermomicrobiales bacterium]
MPTDLYLIRHGESVANVVPIMGGMRGDAGLTARGQRQAALLEARLAGGEIRADALYSSTLPRAFETAAYVARALGLDPVFADEWQELRPGEADGLTVAEWRERYRGGEVEAGDRFRPLAPGGESWATFQARVSTALDRLVTRHPDQTVVVVCHGGVLEASFNHAFGVGPSGNRVYLEPHNTSITHWRHRPGDAARSPAWTLLVFNDATHLRVTGTGDAEREAVPAPGEAAPGEGE